MNNKTRNIVIWVVAFAALMTAAYVFYNKNRTQAIAPPLSTNTASAESTISNATSTEWGSTSSSAEGDSANTASKEAQDGSVASAPTGEEKIMAPDFTLKDLDGNDIKLSDYQGKIVFLNFWAVWCKYCKQEMPDLNKLNAELEKDNDAIILAVDVQETEDVVRKYLTSQNINIKVLMDKDGAVAGTYGVEGYPTTFVINKDGSLYTYIPGATNIDTLHEILKKIRNGEPAQ